MDLIVNIEQPKKEYQIPLDNVLYETDYNFLAREMKEPGSPAFWAERLSKKLNYNNIDSSGEMPSPVKLKRYYDGLADLPFVPKDVESAFRRFQKKARTNFAGQIVDSAADRFAIKGFKTGADDTYNATAWRAWANAGMEVVSKEIFTNMLTFGESYALLGFEKDGSTPRITAETPLTMAVEEDAYGEVAAASKVVYDDIMKITRLFVYMPGYVYVFKCLNSTKPAAFMRNKSYWKNWEYSPEESFATGLDYVNIIVFRNKDGLGEFSKHIDLLDRINEGILNRMIIVSTQAHRQRMIEMQLHVDPDMGVVELPTHDEDGNELDYASLIPSSPGQIGILPPGAKIWESSQSDIQGHLSSVKQDITDLAAVTNTLVNYLFPESANVSSSAQDQSAESFYFKMEDRLRRARRGFEKIAEFILTAGGIEFDDITVAFASLRQPSIQQTAVAYSQITDLPTETKLAYILGMDPNEVQDVMRQIKEKELRERLAASLLPGGSNEMVVDTASIAARAANADPELGREVV